MQKPDSIEDILARLMPPALSVEGQKSIEAVIDELAGETGDSLEAVSSAPSKASVTLEMPSPWFRRALAGGIAAAVAGLAALAIPMVQRPDQAQVAAITIQESPPEFVLVSESDRIESSTDEGWVEDSDGTAMRALRLNVVEENSIRDEETGIVMQVSEPREEILLMPISAF